MKRKIAHISTSHSSDDPRIVYKECISLAKDFDVSLFCLRGLNSKKLSSFNISFYPLKRNQKLLSRIFRNQINIIWLSLKHKIDIVHLHDPELIITAIALKILGKRVVFDIHENFSRRRYKFNDAKTILKSIFQVLYVALEKAAQYFLDKLIVADKDIKDKFSSNNVSIIHNYPLENYRFEAARNKIVYIGDISSDRGFDYFDEINKIAERYSFTFEVYGRWDKPSRDYYKGYILHNDIPKVLQESILGICLLKSTDNYINAVPTKVFEYLKYGVPVICSDFLPIRNKFKEVDGIFFSDTNSRDQTLDLIESALNEIKGSSDIHEQIRKSYQKKNYNWTAEEEKLLEIYSEIKI